METNSEKFYKDMISTCESRISQLLTFSNSSTILEEDKSFSFSMDLSPGKEIEINELIEARSQLEKCRDKDLLAALKDEFCRQLRTHESLRLAKAVIPPSQIVPSSEHHYFKSHDGTRFCHFDGPRIARELILGGIPKLLLAGRDDAQMCQWNLEEAKIAEELGDEITEKDFNTVWFAHGGFPYVRTNRKIRRFLSSAIKKLPS